MKDRKQAGTCPCPFKGCDLIARVYRFKAATDNVKRQRLANRFYCQCDAHGTIGMRGDQAVQDYILDNGEIWGAEKNEETPSAAPLATSSAQPASASSSSSSSTASASQSSQARAPASSGSPPARKVSDLDKFMWGDR